jgi:hypothetical protein
MGLVNVDHGVLTRRDNYSLSYVVHEFGLFVPVEQQRYAAVGGRVIAGNAVIYAFDQAGETVDVRDENAVRSATTWLPTIFDMQRAIAFGLIQRPVIMVNGEMIWRWPEPAPPDMAEAMQEGDGND